MNYSYTTNIQILTSLDLHRVPLSSPVSFLPSKKVSCANPSEVLYPTVWIKSLCRERRRQQSVQEKPLLQKFLRHFGVVVCFLNLCFSNFTLGNPAGAVRWFSILPGSHSLCVCWSGRQRAEDTFRAAEATKLNRLRQFGRQRWGSSLCLLISRHSVFVLFA